MLLWIGLFIFRVESADFGKHGCCYESGKTFFTHSFGMLMQKRVCALEIAAAEHRIAQQQRTVFLLQRSNFNEFMRQLLQ